MPSQQPTLYLTDDSTEVLLYPYLSELIEEKGEKVSFDRISATDFEGFQSCQSPRMNYGFDERARWFRFSVDNQAIRHKEWFVSLAYSSLDDVSVYIIEEDGRLVFESLGDLLPFTERLIDYRNFIIPLNFNINAKQTVYLRIQTEGSLRVPLKIYRSDALLTSLLPLELGWGIYFGFILVMVLYNLMQYFLKKDKIYVYYTLPALMSTTFLLSVNGLYFQYIFPWSPWLANNIIVFSIAGWVLTAAWFAYSFLKVKNTLIKVLLWIAMGLGILGLLLAVFAPYSIGIRYAAAGTIVNALLVLLSGGISWIKGYRSARFFVLSWFLYLLGAIAFALKSAGVLPDTILTANLLPISMMIEVLFLSFAMADKSSFQMEAIATEKEERLRVQHKVNFMLEDKLNKAEQEVSSYRKQLAEYHEEVSAMEEKFKEQQLLTESVENRSLLLKRNIEEQNRIVNMAKEKEESLMDIALRYDAQSIEMDYNQSIIDSFVLSIPKERISGDLSMMLEKDDDLYILVGDFSGHDLDAAIQKNGVEKRIRVLMDRNILDPGDLLRYLHEEILNTGEKNFQLGILRYTSSMEKIDYASASIPMFVISNNKTYHLKGDPFRVGESDAVFLSHSISLKGKEAAPIVYLYSDGYGNQLGDESNIPFTNQRLRELLFLMHTKNMSQQKESLFQLFKKWMRAGTFEQVDDVLILGVRLKK
ncbi:7TM diverse intracellular signaling domain-containing protein [Algivirga pacifica]|uniref:PPM-type phosphatase domain-containing protein n=1 Tax=Algivirga pacifica TaxID=1162670 RepID=A0ABP9DF13_9BACT